LRSPTCSINGFAKRHVDVRLRKKKKKKKKVGSAPIGRTSMLTFPLQAIIIKTTPKKKKKKKAAKIIM
jgi:hypothetical protein